MTVAHELQHCIQHTSVPHLWAASALIPQLSKSAIKTLGLRWSDVPHEREARIIAKKIAQGLFGEERVMQHIVTKAREFVTADDAADWDFIGRIDTSAPYDLALETALIFPKLRSCRRELEKVLKELSVIDPHFKQVDLAALFDATPYLVK
jgi:hypothetical protein